MADKSSSLAHGERIFPRNLALFVILLIEITVLSALEPGYLSFFGLLDALRPFVEPGLISLGMTYVIIVGGIDLSVGSLFALVSVVIGFGYRAHLPLPVSILAGVTVGVVGGAFNGLMVTALRLHPLVITLATLALYRGIAMAISHANAVSAFPAWFDRFGQAEIGGVVPGQLIAWAICALLAWVLLARSRVGRCLYAVGLNERAARFSGVNTASTTMTAYTITGALVGLAALIYTSRVSSARANAGFGLELTVIAMTVLGGADIRGGAGSIGGTVLGVLILAYLQDGLAYAGIRSDWGLIVTGGFLIVAVFLSQRGRAR